MKKGFTLIEVMAATVILVGAILPALFLIVNNINMGENSKNQTLARNAARAKVEEMRNADFSTLVSAYDDHVFDIPGLNGKMRVDADVVAMSSNSLIDVRVVICWRQRGSRIIGEDSNLNGVLNTGEDANNNGHIDSPCMILTSIANKGL